LGQTQQHFWRKLRPEGPLKFSVASSNGTIRPRQGATESEGDWVPRGSGGNWAAFAYGPHIHAPELATPGPRDFVVAPSQESLSFGHPSAQTKRPRLFGQLLVNLENDRLKALAAAERAGEVGTRGNALRELAIARGERIKQIMDALSRLIDRRLELDFPLDQQAPVILVDGKLIPFDLLGDGLASTLGWSADLLMALERTTWSDRTRSPLEQDFWLILDEVDEGLHPQLQARVLPTVRELFPRARIYASTHSPFVVASVGEAVIFPIRPDRDHRVRGEVALRALTPGESLELVTSDILRAPIGFVDEETRTRLRAHREDVDRLRRGEAIDWNAFFVRREALFRQNEEVKTAASFEEVPVRDKVRDEIQKRTEAAE